MEIVFIISISTLVVIFIASVLKLHLLEDTICYQGKRISAVIENVDNDFKDYRNDFSLLLNHLNLEIEEGRRIVKKK